MERFFWRRAEERSIENRYLEGPGNRAWRGLVRQILEAPPDVDADIWGRAFDEFLADIEQEISRSSECCVFISHRMSDVNSALHVAWIATQAGFDYWLDIHDPKLAALNASRLPGPAKDILVAALIEIALLSVTHVIALHTKRSVGSKWIPYELGRAKARLVYSDQAAGWFSRHIKVAACGEYVYLAKQTFTGSDIHNWLLNTKHGRCNSSGKKTWQHGDPPPLDKNESGDDEK